MQTANEEARRLEVLHALKILDTADEAVFDRIAALAARLLGGSAQIAFVDRARVWAKAQFGEGRRELAREESICSLALAEDFFELPNAALDPRTAALGPVREGLRFYAGAAIVHAGARLGMLCVFGPKPRPPLSAADRELLHQLAGLVGDALGQREAARRARAVRGERAAALRTLAAGLAHEINNPIAYVLANLAFAREELAAGAHAGVDEALAEAAQGATKVGALIKELMSYSGIEERTGPVELAPVIAAAVAEARTVIDRRARLVTQIGELPKVRGREERLEQVFLQLLLNAGQALPEGAPEANWIEVRAFTSPAGQAVVEIEDSGRGIAPEHLGRVFDPFFTTRPEGEGAGLGLAISHGIVASMGGELEVESEKGRGALFRVLFPPL